MILLSWFDTPLWSHHGSNVTFLSIALAVCCVAIAIWASRTSQNALHQFGKMRSARERHLIYRLSQVTYYAVLSLGIIVAFSTLGFQFSHFTFLMGALGVGLGLGLQGIFNNFFSGIFLLFEHQLKPGDWIEIEGGIAGEIQDFNFRTTTLRSDTGKELFVPNASLIASQITRFRSGESNEICMKIPFFFPFHKGSFTTLAQEVLEKVPSKPLLSTRDRRAKFYFVRSELRGIWAELWVWMGRDEEKQGKEILSESILCMAEIIQERCVNMTCSPLSHTIVGGDELTEHTPLPEEEDC